MNKNFIYGLVVGLGVLALFGFKSVAERPAPAGGTKWEYMSIREMSTMGSKKFGYYICGSDGNRVERIFTLENGGTQAAEIILLNELGKQGWEVTTKNTAATNGTTQPTVLKRPIQE